MFCVKHSRQLYWQAADILSKCRVYCKTTLDNVMGRERLRLRIGGPQRGRCQEWQWSLSQGHVVSFPWFSVFLSHSLLRPISSPYAYFLSQGPHWNLPVALVWHQLQPQTYMVLVPEPITKWYILSVSVGFLAIDEMFHPGTSTDLW